MEFESFTSDLFLRLTKAPHLLREELLALNPTRPIIIDEIQKIPLQLDEVHYLIEEKGLKFTLTGSSAKKLKRGALEKKMFSLASNEIADFNLGKIINFGSLPAIYLSKIPKEEIAAEGLIRNLEPFLNFLDLV